MPSRVFMDILVLVMVTDRLRTASIRVPLAAKKRSFTWALTSFSFAICRMHVLEKKGGAGCQITHLGIMDKRAATSVWWLLAGCGIFEALDDSLQQAIVFITYLRWKPTYSFPAPVVAYNDGYWGVKLYNRHTLVVKGANATDGKLVERSPVGVYFKFMDFV
jgi:hypothetical protein